MNALGEVAWRIRRVRRGAAKVRSIGDACIVHRRALARRRPAHPATPARPRPFFGALTLEGLAADERAARLADQIVDGFAQTTQCRLMAGSAIGALAEAVSVAGIVITGQCAWRTTASATLPSRARETPVRPWVP